MRQAITLCTALTALVLAAPAAMAEGSPNQSGKFCLKGPGTAQSCQYDTMAACEKDKKTGQQCAANASTTGTAAPGGTLNNNMKK